MTVKNYGNQDPTGNNAMFGTSAMDREIQYGNPVMPPEKAKRTLARLELGGPPSERLDP